MFSWGLVHLMASAILSSKLGVMNSFKLSLFANKNLSYFNIRL